jgi:hypothetical protein
VKAVVRDAVIQILQSPQMRELWSTTNRDAHAEFVRQLDAGSPQVTIDLGPCVSGVLAEIKQTKLAPVADQIQIAPAAARISIQGGALERVRQGYEDLKAATVIVLALTLLFAALSVWVSVHHLKTLRRMLIGTGLTALAVSAGIALSAKLPVHGADPATAKLAVAMLQTLLHPLLAACLVVGAICVALALGSKLYEKLRARA